MDGGRIGGAGCNDLDEQDSVKVSGESACLNVGLLRLRPGLLSRVKIRSISMKSDDKPGVLADRVSPDLLRG